MLSLIPLYFASTASQLEVKGMARAISRQSYICSYCRIFVSAFVPIGCCSRLNHYKTMIIFLNKKVCYELLYSVATFYNFQGRLTFVFALRHTFNDSHSHHCSHIKIVQAEKNIKDLKVP
jgi:hypothetical protein